MEQNVQAGFNAHIYAAGGTGSFPAVVSTILGLYNGTAPSWAEISTIGNITLNITKSEGDVSIRGAGGFKLTANTLTDISLDFEMPYVRNDLKREALVNAAFLNTVVGICFLDGTINDAASSQGFVADMQISALPIDANMANPMTQKFTLKPAFPSSDTAGVFSKPSLCRGSSGGTLTLLSALA